MLDAPEQPPRATESSRTHASPGPHTETSKLIREHEEELQQQWPNQPPIVPARSARYTAPRVRGPVNDARGHARQVQRNTPDRGTDPPQFARASQNIVAATMLLCSLSEPNDPHERAIHRNLQALLETAAVQQVECSILRHRLMTSLLVRGTGTQQMGHYALSPQQPLSAAHEAATTPRLDLTTTPHQPSIYTRLEPNRGTCSGDRSPNIDGLGPPTFAQLPQ